MAETLFSPGVLAIENEQPIINAQPIQVGAAIIGPTAIGPVEIPTVVTSYSDYTSKFGSIFRSGSQFFTYFTSISAFNYFQNGGTSLLVTRVTSASFSSATSVSPGGGGIPNALESGVISTESNALLSSISSVSASIGTYTISGSTSGTGTGFTGSVTLNTETSVSSLTATSGGSGYTIGDTITIPSQSMGMGGIGGTNLVITLNAEDIINQNTFTLETISEGVEMNSTSTEASDGSLPSGSDYNLRWEIQSPDTDEGTFSLLIRRGDDFTDSPIILETFSDLSLDPKSPNYIEKIVGNQKEVIATDGSDTYIEVTGNYSNQSQYVRVKSVSYTTPDYLDNSGDPKTEFTASIPIVSSGSFGGATGTNVPGPSAGAGNYYKNIDNANNTQGLISDDYTTAIALLKNKDEFKYNFITAPGLIKDFSNHSSNVSNLVSNCQERGDTMAIIDLLDYQATLLEVTTEAKSINNSFAAAYWPWVQTLDPNLATQVFVPASTLIPGVYAFNDSSAEVWFAPAGTTRGIMPTAIRAERNLTKSNRDDLYKANVNPLATFTTTGVTVFGQKTLNKRKTATNRINVRRLLIELKTQIGNIAETLVFEQNTIATRNQFLEQVNPFLTSVQEREGLTDFRVVMDETNNTPTTIDNNQLIGDIFIKPTKSAEFITLNFNITPTGVDFT
tara:strand:+ start:821 stop:2848 length:2028 start_codon:yes stop_codon:yes gene_type:complete